MNKETTRLDKADVMNLITTALRKHDPAIRILEDGGTDDPALGIEFSNGQFFFIDVREDEEEDEERL